MSCCLESSPSLEPALVTQRQQKHFLPRPLTCPQPFLRPPRQKHCWGLQPVCLSVRALFYIFIFLGGRTGIRRHPRQQLGCFFFFLSLHVKEKGRTAGESVFSGNL